MPKLPADSHPRYRHHKSSGQAVVTLCGRDFYLGPFGTSASRHAYDRLIAEWSGNGRSLPVAGAEISVVELIAAYRKHAAEYYRHSSEYEATLLSLRPLKELYCRLPACEFSPLKLKAVRQKMIESDLCRNEVNKRIGRIKRMFRWGVENELVSPIVRDALQAVAGLARGRSAARETERVRPAPLDGSRSPDAGISSTPSRAAGLGSTIVGDLSRAGSPSEGNLWPPAYVLPGRTSRPRTQ